MSTFVKGRIEIEYDPSARSDQTVLQPGVRIDHRPALEFTLASIAGHPGDISAITAPVKAVLPEVWAAVDETRQTAPGTFVFRDAADRFHEVLVGPIWSAALSDGNDQGALHFVREVIQLLGVWEDQRASTHAYVHAGTLFFYAAISSLRLRNIDSGILFLEAGELTDKQTYGLAGKPGEELSRPGTLTLTIQPDPKNMLYADVLALREMIRKLLEQFDKTGRVPPGSALTMDDFDDHFLRDYSNITATKLVFAFLCWKAYLLDDPQLNLVPHGGAHFSRRRAELLLGLLTAAEQIVREVEASGTNRYADVINGLAKRDWQGPAGSSAEPALQSARQTYKEDFQQCLLFWNGGLPGYPIGLAWYVAWLETGRLIRNQIAHDLESSAPIVTNWVEAEGAAWFALFSAVLLRRDSKVKQTRKPPTTPPTPFFGGIPVPAPGSGIANLYPITTQPNPGFPGGGTVGPEIGGD